MTAGREQDARETLWHERLVWLGQHADRDDYDLATAQDALDDAWRILAALLPSPPATGTPTARSLTGAPTTGSLPDGDAGCER